MTRLLMFKHGSVEWLYVKTVAVYGNYDMHTLDSLWDPSNYCEDNFVTFREISSATPTLKSISDWHE
jgi:hypothetical protein